MQCQQVVQYMHKNLHGWRCRWIKLFDVDESVRFITFLKYSHHLSIFLSLLFAKNLNLHTQDKTWVAKFRRWPYDKLVMYFHEAVALIINFQMSFLMCPQNMHIFKFLIWPLILEKNFMFICCLSVLPLRLSKMLMYFLFTFSSAN